MAEEILDDFLDFWDSMSSTALKVAEYQNAKANSDANRETAIKLEDKRIQFQMMQDDLQFQKSQALDVQRDNEKMLLGKINELELWNLNAETAVGLDKKWQTDDAKKIFTDMGIVLNSDLTVGYNTQGTTRQIINKINKANEVQESVISNLDGMLGEIHKSQDFLDNVGVDKGIPLVKDIEDLQHYIDSNPIDAYGTPLFPEDDPRTPLNEGYLRKAFTSNKMQDIGIGPQYQAALLHNQLLTAKSKGGASKVSAIAHENQMSGRLLKEDEDVLETALAGVQLRENSSLIKSHVEYLGINLLPIGSLQDETFADPSLQKDLALKLADNIFRLLRGGDKHGGGHTYETFPLLNELFGGENAEGNIRGNDMKVFNAYQIAELLLSNEVPELIKSTVDDEEFYDFNSEVYDKHIVLNKQAWSEIETARKEDPEAYVGLDINKDYGKFLYIDERGHISTQEHFKQEHPDIQFKPYTRPASRFKYKKQDLILRNSELQDEDHSSPYGLPLWRLDKRSIEEGIPLDTQEMPFYTGTLPGKGDYPARRMTEEEIEDYGVEGRGYQRRTGPEGEMENWWYYPNATPDAGLIVGTKGIDPLFKYGGARLVEVPSWTNIGINLDPGEAFDIFHEQPAGEGKMKALREFFHPDYSVKPSDDVPLENLLVDYLKAYKTLIDMSPGLTAEVIEYWNIVEGDKFPDSQVSPYLLQDRGFITEEIIDFFDTEILDQEELGSMFTKKIIN